MPSADKHPQCQQHSNEASLCLCGNHKAQASDHITMGLEDLAQSMEIRYQTDHYRNGTDRKTFQLMKAKKGQLKNSQPHDAAPGANTVLPHQDQPQSLMERFKPIAVPTSPILPPSTQWIQLLLQAVSYFNLQTPRSHLFNHVHP